MKNRIKITKGLNLPPEVRAAANRRATQTVARAVSGCNWGRSSHAGVEASLKTPRVARSGGKTACPPPRSGGAGPKPSLKPNKPSVLNSNGIIAPKCGRCGGGNCGSSSNAGVTVSPELMPRVAASGGHSSGGSSGASSNPGVEVNPDRMHRVARTHRCGGRSGASSQCGGRGRSGSTSRCEACSSSGGTCSHSNLANENFGGHFPFLRSSPEDIL